MFQKTGGFTDSVKPPVLMKDINRYNYVSQGRAGSVPGSALCLSY